MAAPYRAGTLMTQAEIDKQTHGLRVKYEYRKNLAPPSDPDFHTRKAMVRLFLALARGAPRERPCGKSSHVITEVLTRGHLEVWEDAMVASCCGGVFGSTVDELASMLGFESTGSLSDEIDVSTTIATLHRQGGARGGPTIDPPLFETLLNEAAAHFETLLAKQGVDQPKQSSATSTRMRLSDLAVADPAAAAPNTTTIPVAPPAPSGTASSSSSSSDDDDLQGYGVDYHRSLRLQHKT